MQEIWKKWGSLPGAVHDIDELECAIGKDQYASAPLRGGAKTLSAVKGASDQNHVTRTTLTNRA